ncbi:MAG: hypothetical protein Ct9H300mP14_05400 [Gammaproteobacteria bacterium]|nr:MAG: hypothetical protein Ct9H300mP14_05400 [Gammaproteobacteria bacterium]
MRTVLSEATLSMPEITNPMSGGRTGLHSEHLGYLLAEMQFLQRAYPGAHVVSAAVENTRLRVLRCWIAFVIPRYRLSVFVIWESFEVLTYVTTKYRS